jgi:hypothetical protein
MRSRRLEWMELSFFLPQRSVSSHYIFSLFFYVPRDGNFAQIVVIQNLRSLYDGITRAHKMISISFSSRSWDKLTNNILNGALLEFDNCCVNVPRVTWFCTAGRKFHRRGGGIMTSMLRKSGSNSGSKSLEHEPSSPAEEQVKVIHRWTIWFKASRFGC